MISGFALILLLLSFPLLGIVILTGGLIFRSHQKSKIVDFVPILGRVILNTIQTIGGEGTSYLPLVKYTVKNETFTVHGNIGYVKKRLKILK
jgi:hypothetical protein